MTPAGGVFGRFWQVSARRRSDRKHWKTRPLRATCRNVLLLFQSFALPAELPVLGTHCRVTAAGSQPRGATVPVARLLPGSRDAGTDSLKILVVCRDGCGYGVGKEKMGFGREAAGRYSHEARCEFAQQAGPPAAIERGRRRRRGFRAARAARDRDGCREVPATH